MNYHIITFILFLIILTFIFSFCIGNVAASQSDTLYVNGSSGNDSWNGLNSTWINNTNGPKLSIKNATESVNSGGSVYIARGIYNETNIPLNTNMTIIGDNQNGTIISGDTGSVFNIASGVNITIINITFTNETNDNGGAIINHGYLTVINSCFTYNTASSNGGAIYNDNTGVLTLIANNFTNNTATNFGGAIYNDGTLNAIYNNFTNNLGGMGGAIYNDGTLTIFNSDMTYNNAYDGGAIVNGGNLLESQCNFTNNKAMCAGGAIFNYNTVKLNFSSLIGNIANTGNSLYNYMGLMDASQNWWGSNCGPSNNIYSTIVTSWIILTIKSNLSIMPNNSHSTITVDLLHDSNGNFHDPMSGEVPELTVIFNTTLGTITHQIQAVNGIAISDFNGGSTGGIAIISALIDNQTVTIPIVIDNISPTVESNIKPGYYNVSKLVSLSISKRGNIYYTLNGKTPTTTSIKYCKSIIVNSTETLKYIAVDLAGNKSPIYTQIFIIDKVPPKISMTKPVNDSIRVSLTSPITIKFNENITAGINYSKIYVKDLNTNKFIHIAKTISGNTLTIKQTSIRIRNNIYEVYIPWAVVKDKAGNNLKLGYMFKFKT